MGKIGLNRYFCPESCHEITISRKKSLCYYPAEDGAVRLAGNVIDVARNYQMAHSKC